MDRELREYFINQVIKIAKYNKPFSWIEMSKKICLNCKEKMRSTDDDNHIEQKIYALCLMESIFNNELEIMLTKEYITPFRNEEGRYILSKKGKAAKNFGSLSEHELFLNKKIKSETKSYYKKFDRELISFLEKQPQKDGDISNIVNKFIKDKQDNSSLILKQLIYLSRDKDILEIKEFPEDDMQAQNDWWGNFIGINITRGDKVEGLKAKLSNGYIKLSYWERNPIKTKILGWVIPYILGVMTTLITCKNILPINTPKDKQEIAPSEIKIVPKKYDDATNYDSLHHNKDSVSLNNTFPKKR